MVDTDSVAIDQSRDDLAKDVNDMDLNESALLVDVAEQLAAFNVLHDEVAAIYLDVDTQSLLEELTAHLYSPRYHRGEQCSGDLAIS